MSRLSRPPTNLPLQLTSFIGRTPELHELRHLVSESRLVTIAGGPGMGKTRIALELARQVLDDHPGGVWFASLAAHREPGLVPHVVAGALGVRGQSSEPVLEGLAARLDGALTMLVLDNCEHLVDSTARLAEFVLRSCAQVRVLATSQEPLRVPGETVFRVGPMALPSEGGSPDHDAEELAESVRLFAARAQLAQPHFALDARSSAAVDHICRRLDGIPLAIELAAARTEMMSVPDILDRLEDRFHLLTAGMRTDLPRHQTLRAALDWGHLLLEDAERRLFRRLSVFAGGFNASAAETVCAGPDLGADEVVGLLSGLVDKSFVSPEPTPAGPTRYRILETVRQYGADRLLESGEADRVRFRHADHCLSLAESAEPKRLGPQQESWRLELESQNLRDALEWCRAHDAGRWLRLATALGWFWVTHGHLAEGREWLEGALALTSLDLHDRARGFLWQARMAYWQGDYESGLEMCEQSAAIYRELEDDLNLGWPLLLIGQIRMYQGDLAEARRSLDEVLAVTANDEVRLEATMALGELLVQSGELAEARERLEDCLEWARAPGERWRVATAIFLLGIVALFEGDLDRARGHVAESMDAFSKVGNKYALASQIDIMAGVAVAEADPERALLLSAAADQIRASIRAQLAPHWADVRRRVVLAPAREALGDRAEAALASGRQLTVEEAMALAKGRPATNGSARERGHHDRPPTRLVLSRREREVAGLVAEGMTNRQIAERLVLAERTVEGHVERIRGKLKVHSRTQIAVWVVEQARA